MKFTYNTKHGVNEADTDDEWFGMRVIEDRGQYRIIVVPKNFVKPNYYNTRCPRAAQAFLEIDKLPSRSSEEEIAALYGDIVRHLLFIGVDPND